MKLIGYKGTGKGIYGLTDVLIRYRLKGIYSHTEIMFEKGDGVEHLMPDGRLDLGDNNFRWCASSSGMDTIPNWSPIRPGKKGGVRFKQININKDHWDFVELDKDPVEVATLFKAMQGIPYDYVLVFSYLAWVLRQDRFAVNCSEICAMALSYEEPWRYDPCILMEIVKKEKCHAKSPV